MYSDARFKFAAKNRIERHFECEQNDRLEWIQTSAKEKHRNGHSIEFYILPLVCYHYDREYPIKPFDQVVFLRECV